MNLCSYKSNKFLWFLLQNNFLRDHSYWCKSRRLFAKHVIQYSDVLAKSTGYFIFSTRRISKEMRDIGTCKKGFFSRYPEADEKILCQCLFISSVLSLKRQSNHTRFVFRALGERVWDHILELTIKFENTLKVPFKLWQRLRQHF